MAPLGAGGQGMGKLTAARERLQRNYIDGIPTKLDVLRQATAAFDRNSDDAEASIRRLAHQIAGSAASFGFPALGDRAQAAELAPLPSLHGQTLSLIGELEHILAQHHVSTAKILIVDDDPSVASIAGELIASPRRALYHAANQEQALQELAARDWQLIILDLILPDTDGRYLLMKIRSEERTRDVPVIVLSAKTNTLVKNECAAYGIDAFLEKPIDARTFPSVVSSSLQRNQTFMREAYSDELTGVHNRMGFRKVFDHSLALCRRRNQSMALAMIDLDHFKLFNDRHGHEVGDAALVTTSEALRDKLRRSDIIGRWGGEEFVIAFPECSAAHAAAALRKVAAELCTRQVGTNCTTIVTFSGGVVEIGSSYTIDLALARADQLLYAAKRQGRDQVLFGAPVSAPAFRPRVLVAEDDPDLARLLLAELAKDYEAVHAADGREAMALIDGEPTFDLVLLDCMMPGKSGLEVLTELRNIPAYRTQPIVMLTAVGSDAIVEEAFSRGADDYILKPYRKRQLLARLSRHVGEQARA